MRFIPTYKERIISIVRTNRFGSISIPAALNLFKLGSNRTPIIIAIEKVSAATTLEARVEGWLKARMIVVIIIPAINAITIVPRIGLRANHHFFLISLPLPVFLLLLSLCSSPNHQRYQSGSPAPSSFLIASLALEKFLLMFKHVSNCFLALSYLFSLAYNKAK